MQSKVSQSHLSEHCKVQICYSLKNEYKEQKSYIVEVTVLNGSCIRDAVIQAINEKKLDQVFPDFKLNSDLESKNYGIFGKKKLLKELLKKGDRIEIYHPLIANPMDARRSRVGKAGKINVKN